MERDHPGTTTGVGVEAPGERHDPTAFRGPAGTGTTGNGHGFGGNGSVPVVPQSPVGTHRRPRVGQQFVPTVFYGSIWLVLALFIGLVVLALNFPADLGDPADPLNKKLFIPRPEWYFLPLFQVLKVFQGPLELVGTVVLPGIVTVVLIALPFYDRNWSKRPRKRPVAMTLVTAFMVVLLWLTWQSEGSPLPFTGAGGQTAPVVAKSGGKLTYSDVYPIFQSNCAQCHFAGGTAVSIINLSKYENFFGSGHPGGPVQGPVVVKGDHTKSYLWDVIAGVNLQGGAAMPLGMAQLPKQQIDAIAQWIDNGAAK